MSSDADIIYTEEEIIEFEAIFGIGFMSPGGPEEVAKIVENANLVGKEVLDIGVGIGGPAILLVEKHGAARVIGIDIELLMCSLLILARKTAVTSCVRIENCCELSFHGVILSYRPGVTYEADYSDVR